jgi:hypothetical protein
MNNYKKEEFIHLLQSYIQKLNDGTITFREGLLLTEFFTKNKLQNDTTYNDAKEDALSYAFLGYYIKELCKQP